MNRILIAGISGFLGLTLLSAVGMASPDEVPAPVSDLFIPNGFDSNDNVEVIAHGNFANACWRVGRSGAVVDHDAMKIEIWVTAYKYSNEDDTTVCAQMMLPFIEPIKIGVLKRGNYDVSVRDTTTMNQLSVVGATTDSPDEYNYAMVTSAGVDRLDDGQQQLWIRGRHPHFLIGCMVLEDVSVRRDPENVLIVLPIGRMEEGEVCDSDDYDYEFKAKINLNGPIVAKSLLHVRVMNGNSFNALVHAN